MKIMIDECITAGPAQVLIAFFALAQPPIEAHFVVEYFGAQGMKDQHWSDVLQQEGDWFVITGDRGVKDGKKKRLVDGPPLPSILPRKGITAVYINGRLQRAPGTEKVQAITAVSEQIIEFFKEAKPGARKILTRPGKTYVLKDW